MTTIVDDMCLKFDTKEQADEVIFPDGCQVYRNVMVIGEIRRPTGEVSTDSEGGETEVMETLPGYHVNVLCLSDEDATILEAYRVFPANRKFVWAI